MTKWIQLLSNALKFENDYGVRESRRFGAASEKGSDFNWFFFSLSLHTATLIVVAFKWVNSINLYVGMINQSIDFFKRHFLSEGNKIYFFLKVWKLCCTRFLAVNRDSILGEKLFFTFFCEMHNLCLKSIECSSI